MQAEVEKTPTAERWRLSHNGVPYWYVTKTAKGWSFQGAGGRVFDTADEAKTEMLLSRMKRIRKELERMKDAA